MWERCAEPGIRMAAEPDSIIMPHQTTGTIYRNYNLLLDKAKEIEGLEALCLIHQDAEIVDPDFCSTLRETIKDPDVALVGCAGALGVRSIAWWEGAVTWASFTHRYLEHGGGDMESLSWKEEDTPTFATTGEVDSIDGFVICFTPWAIENLRFDENLGKLHGYDFDICCQAREKGRKVMTMDAKMVHHHSLQLVSDPETWAEAFIRLNEKWEGRLPGIGAGGDDWERRAKFAEGDAAASRTLAASDALKREAVENEMERLRNSLSWKVTRPLRWLAGLFRRS